MATTGAFRSSFKNYLKAVSFQAPRSPPAANMGGDWDLERNIYVEAHGQGWEEHLRREMLNHASYRKPYELAKLWYHVFDAANVEEWFNDDDVDARSHTLATGQ